MPERDNTQRDAEIAQAFASLKAMRLFIIALASEPFITAKSMDAFDDWRRRFAGLLDPVQFEKVAGYDPEMVKHATLQEVERTLDAIEAIVRVSRGEPPETVLSPPHPKGRL